MACSAVALSVATVSAVVALTCTSIAFGTDNWYEVRVNPDGNERLASLQEFESDLRYYSRDEGIFRICFPDKRPKGVQTYMSPVQTQCINIDYYINDNGNSDTFTDQRWMRLPGHFFCAKCAHLYMQDMLNLKDRIDPIEYEKFMEDGYFTIRRTDKFWSGIWSNQSIEQTVMKTMKRWIDSRSWDHRECSHSMNSWDDPPS
ncbi:hypothetical protein AVEN_85353-1 [Araneus ventricosus]|uniref:Uncharacterized protein n=1 Tax=Araneus ventricosus TaxID=182803 RepID=A0A4Y2DXD1_ARAVE|nr:hypothetical protein AVEN_85353-1 [Araneus ventricosus]